MSNRIPKRQRIGSYKHKKGNTPYKWYMDRANIIKLKYNIVWV